MPALCDGYGCTLQNFVGAGGCGFNFENTCGCMAGDGVLEVDAGWVEVNMLVEVG